MIVSASYRTDIPALYSAWFLNRFRAGYARVVNPYGGRVATVPLRQGVDGFVFWTRNIAPFAGALAEVRRAGIPFVIQHTITGYPRALEQGVIAPAAAVAGMREVARLHGPHTVVWRYDPVVLSSLTPPDFHRAMFSRLADAVVDVTDEVVVSFVTPYRKTVANMNAAARRRGFQWSQPSLEAKRSLLAELAETARDRGLRLVVCAQPDLLIPGIDAAACIDAARLRRVAASWGLSIAPASRSRGNRPGCLCHESRDIGAYESCPQGCAYCYAVGSTDLAKRRRRDHDPDADSLDPLPPLREDGAPKLL